MVLLCCESKGDAYFSKVPFLAPLVAEGIQVITRMRKDAVAWDERIENEPKKSLSFSRLRRGLQHLAIARVLAPKSASGADLPSRSSELDRILRLTA